MRNDKNAVIAVYTDHEAAETAVKKLAATGVDISSTMSQPSSRMVFWSWRHGPADEMLRAKEFLDTSGASLVDLHEIKATPQSIEEVA